MAKKRKPKTSKHCDKLWSEMVRAAGKCAICGRSDVQLHAHHLITRSARFFRHNLNNGMCLCPRCHEFNIGDVVDGVRRISAHQTPEFFREWMWAHLPEQAAWWEKNRYAVAGGAKIDYDQVYDALKNWLEV